MFLFSIFLKNFSDPIVCACLKAKSKLLSMSIWQNMGYFERANTIFKLMYLMFLMKFYYSMIDTKPILVHSTGVETLFGYHFISFISLLIQNVEITSRSNTLPIAF